MDAARARRQRRRGLRRRPRTPLQQPGSPELNAEPADQIRLLEVQSFDARLAQLDHQRSHLPEHAEAERLTADAAELDDLLVAARTEEGDTAREQTKAEQDVDQVRQRAARDQQRLDSGAVTSPKDLENLQREIASLARRQGDLEDIVLEVMERRETAQDRVAELTQRLEQVRARGAEVASRRAARIEEIETESNALAKERESGAAQLPADLLGLYDRLRAQSGGVGAAKLFQKRCEGCRLELNITELNEIRSAAPDAVVRCENCRRILVRTPDSGL